MWYKNAYAGTTKDTYPRVVYHIVQIKAKCVAVYFMNKNQSICISTRSSVFTEACFDFHIGLFYVISFYIDQKRQVIDHPAAIKDLMIKIITVAYGLYNLLFDIV